MNWDTIQQVLRILLYTFGGWAFGDAVAQGAEFQAAVGGILAFGAFVWWFFWERKRPEGINSMAGPLVFAGVVLLGLSGLTGGGQALFAMMFVVIVMAVWLSAARGARNRPAS